MRTNLSRLLVLATLVACATLVALPRPAAAGLWVEGEYDHGESPRWFLFELKFGPYKPDIDSEFGSGAGPYEDIFGSSSFLLSAVQFEVELMQRYGMLSLGGGVAFGTTSGMSLDHTGGKSTDSTSLYLLPLNLSVAYHLDIFARLYRFPLVPYVRAGFDYVVWWTTDGLGDISDWAADAAGATQNGYGGVWGWHVSGGLKLLLDVFAPTMARTFDMEMGVNSSYLFAELIYLRADDFGSDKSLNLSALTYSFGIAFEF